MASDFLSLVLQAIGGAIADTANTDSLSRVGVDIMIAGLFLQAVSLFAFVVVFADFSWRCRKGVLDMDPEKQRIRRSLLFGVFRASLFLATLAILVRSIFRVAELWQGFHGDLWNNETDFLVLDGCSKPVQSFLYLRHWLILYSSVSVMAIAVLCLTAMHPGVAFGGQWQAADWNLKSAKKVLSQKPQRKGGEIGS